jgi:hypothetical protein
MDVHFYSIIRLEFNQSHLNYYTELDAVQLRGSRIPPSISGLSNSHSVPSPLDNILPIRNRQLCMNVSDHHQSSIRHSLTPTEILMRNFIHLNMQDGLSAALDRSDNGFFDLLPVRSVQRFDHFVMTKHFPIGGI